MGVSKQVQTNTFNSGLNMDLNPLLTPNDVMTDCLNGTIVTYNGNEFALQNDLGNYKFKNGSLSEGFVPIGIKEYANILYIVSYNAITDEVEIGSFPSMKIINDFDSKSIGGPCDIELLPGDNLYSSLSKQSSIQFLSEITDDCSINPGDEYILSVEDDDEIKSLYQNTSIYIYTKNNKLYNINSYIEVSRQVDTSVNDAFNNVTWDVPGWLALQSKINVMSDFDVNINNIKTASSKIVNVNIRSLWDKDEYNKKLENGSLIEGIRSCLKYKYIVHGKNESIDINDLKSRGEVLSNNYLVEYNLNYAIYSVLNLSADSYITVCPYLEIGSSKIWYDQFVTTLDLAGKAWEEDNLSSIIQNLSYNVSSSGCSINIEVVCPPSKSKFYRFKKYDGEGWSPITQWSNAGGIDSSIIVINESFSGDFIDEDIYTLELSINDGNYPLEDVVDGEIRLDSIVYLTKLINKVSNQNLYDINPKILAELVFSQMDIYLDIDKAEKSDYYGLSGKRGDNEYDYNWDYSTDPQKWMIDSIESSLSSLTSTYNKNDFINDQIKSKFGKQYKFSKSDCLDLPKDSNGNVGRMWEPIYNHISNINFEGYISNESGKLDIMSDSSDNVYINSYSSSLIYMLSDEISKNVSKNNKRLSLNEPWIVEQNGVFKFNKFSNYSYRKDEIDMLNVFINEYLDVSFNINKNNDGSNEWDLIVNLRQKNAQDSPDGKLHSKEYKWVYVPDSPYKWHLYGEHESKLNDIYWEFLGIIFHFNQTWWKVRTGSPVKRIKIENIWNVIAGFPHALEGDENYLKRPLRAYSKNNKSISFMIIGNEISKRWDNIHIRSKNSLVNKAFIGSNIKFTTECQHEDAKRRSIPGMVFPGFKLSDKYIKSISADHVLSRRLLDVNNMGWETTQYNDFYGLEYSVDALLTYFALMASTIIHLDNTPGTIYIPKLASNHNNKESFISSKIKLKISNMTFDSDGLSDCHSEFLKHLSGGEILIEKPFNEVFDTSSNIDYIGFIETIINKYNNIFKVKSDNLKDSDFSQNVISIDQDCTTNIRSLVEQICNTISYDPESQSIVGKSYDAKIYLEKREGDNDYCRIFGVSEYGD